jgi:putative Ig domain-containing protein
MNNTRLVRAALVSTAALCALGGQGALADGASAVTVAKGELKGGQLRLQGGNAAPGIFVIASSATSSAGVRSDQRGQFDIRASGFSSPDCKVTVSDSGRTPIATVTLAGCAPSVVPVPSSPAPPTGSCVITPQAGLLSVTANASSVVNFGTTGCNTTFNTGPTPTPVQWKVVAGIIPTGMSGPDFQGQTSANLIGTPTVPGSYTFTLQATDSTGASDQETFTVTVS